MCDVLKKISEIGIVPVVKLDDSKNAVGLAKALIKGGLPCAEITFRTSAAKDSIKQITDEFPEMLVGAGTVLTINQVDEAIEAGAKFIVSPGFDAEIVKYCVKKEIPVLPGCTTPTDYHAALKFNLSVIKFFPAEQSGGLKKIKAMSAPFPMFKVMPTGGISLNNLKEYISCPTICACGGSYMVTADLINNQKWDEITELCKKSVEIVKEARNNG